MISSTRSVFWMSSYCVMIQKAVLARRPDGTDLALQLYGANLCVW